MHNCYVCMLIIWFQYWCYFRVYTVFVLGPLRDPPSLVSFQESVVTRIPAAKWRGFGIALGIPSDTLDEYALRTPRRRYKAIFQEWEKLSQPPRWESILQALRADIVGQRCLADILSERLRTSQQWLLFGKGTFVHSNSYYLYTKTHLYFHIAPQTCNRLFLNAVL